jgi:hypothetical protein
MRGGGNIIAWENNLESQRHNKLAQPKVSVVVNILDFYSGGARFESRSGIAYSHTSFHGFIHFLQENAWGLSRVLHKRCFTNDFQVTNMALDYRRFLIDNWIYLTLTDLWI